MIVIVMLLIALAIAMKLYTPQWANQPDPDITRAVRGVLDAQAAAWNRGDLDAFMQGYWNSPELKFYHGKDITSGWEATLQRYRDRYQAKGKEMGHLTFSDVEVKPIDTQHAWVRGRWKVETSKETSEGLYTLICQHTPQGWRIVHDHTSAAERPPPEKTTP
jgi:ketosteroid isomerase-like protein